MLLLWIKLKFYVARFSVYPSKHVIMEDYKWNFPNISFSVPKEFHSADYFWSFEDSEGNQSDDAVRKRAAQLMGGSLVVATSDRGHVADTGKPRGWISLGDFKGNRSSYTATI